MLQKIDNYFELTARGSSIITEFRGAVATFLTMAYILAVNPRILSESGGPCEYGDGGPDGDEYLQCMEETKRKFVVATALTSMVACLIMGLWANLPIALSCGMGMNAFFTYNVVGFKSFGNISYGAALSAVLIEGIVFFVISVTGLRYYIIKTFIPEPVRLATPAAIGAFLAHLGLQTAEGLGVVVADVATAVTLGGCPVDKRTPMVPLDDRCIAGEGCLVSDAYTCDTLGGHMESPTAWIGIFGTLVMVVLLAYKVKSSFIIGIGFVTLLSWFRGTAVTYFPDDTLGNERFEYFKKIVSVESLTDITAKWDFSEAKGGEYAISLITLLYVDFLDTSGTLLAIVSSMGYVDEDGDFPKSRAAFTTDAIATIFGSLFGLSPVTSYIESAAGVEIGSRTGLTSVFVAFFFFLSIFFAPILSSIPAWATGGSLIIVGALMCRSLAKVHWDNPCHAVTAFVTVIVMPLTYSIAYGLIAGIGTWFFIKGVAVPLNLVFGIADPTIIMSDKGEDLNEITEDDKGKEKAGNDDDVKEEKFMDA